MKYIIPSWIDAFTFTKQVESSLVFIKVCVLNSVKSYIVKQRSFSMAFMLTAEFKVLVV